MKPMRQRVPFLGWIRGGRAFGFTLIELLVVIVIIAILAALLLPSLGRAKEQAKAVGCANNLHQLQLAFLVYTEDFDRMPYNAEWALFGGQIPQAPNWVAGTLSFETDTYPSRPSLSESTNRLMLVGPNLHGSIGDYTKSADIYKCPADASYVIFPGGTRHSRVRSYGLNGYVGPPGPDVPSMIPPERLPWMEFRKLSDFTRCSPSQIFAFTDVHEDAIRNGFFYIGGYQSLDDVWPGEFPASRHGRKGAFSFVDGHIELHRWQDPRTVQPSLRRTRVFPSFWTNPDYAWLRERATFFKPEVPPIF